MQDLSLHILDIAENSIAAEAKTIRIHIKEDRKKDRLRLEIDDDGKGMDKETIRRAMDPFFTTKKTRRFGLGLSLLSEACKAANGRFAINSKAGKGTRVTATFQASHIDTKPFGDIPQTLISLIIGHPGVDLIYRHSTENEEYSMSTKDIKAQLNGLSIDSPEVLTIIKQHIKEGIASLRR
jgi:hypothetical protein